MNDDTQYLQPDGSADQNPLKPGAKSDGRPPTRAVYRVGTIVWGLVVVTYGVLVLAAVGGADLDGGTVAIVVLGGAGAALVIGSAVSAIRRTRQSRRDQATGGTERASDSSST